MGSSAVAANSVAQVARQLATVVTFGVSSAAAIYLGKTIGEKKMEHAKAYAHKFLVLSLLLGIAGGAVNPDDLAGSHLTDGADADGKRIFAVYVLCHVLFCDRTGCEHNAGCRRIPFRGRYQVRTDPGYEYNVGMLDPVWIPCGVCLPLECSGRVYDPDER